MLPIVALGQGDGSEADDEDLSVDGEDLSVDGEDAAAAEDDGDDGAGDEDADGEAGEEDEEAEEAEPPIMDLEALLARALDDYPGLDAADARIRAARAQLDEAWVSPFFQSVITAGFTLAPETRGSPIFSPDSQLPLENPWQPVLGFAIEGFIPLWTFGKLGAARDAARAGIHAAEGDRERVEDTLTYDVRRAYFAHQLSLDIQQMLSEGLPRIRQALEEVEARLAAEDPEVDQFDRYRLAAALAEIEGREAQAHHLERSSRAALRILTGVRRFRVPDCPISPASIDLEELEYYLARGGEERPEVRMLEAAVRAREAALDVAEAGFLPDIALTYRFATSYAPGVTDQTNPFIVDPANYTSFGAGLVMRWSLDLWGNAYRVDRASALLDDTREMAETAEGGIELEITDAYETVVEARERMEAYDRGRRETRAWFIAAAQAVDVGAAELGDLTDAVSAYFLARYAHLQAIHDLDVAIANLERVTSITVATRWEDDCD
jgi:outer membrane protein TolC